MFFNNINKLISKNEGCKIVDVRSPEEYSMGHIPGAINIPNETINNTAPPALPDRSELILVYCLSGIRASQAVNKLKNMGYSQVINAGGIKAWDGEIQR